MAGETGMSLIDFRCVRYDDQSRKGRTGVAGHRHDFVRVTQGMWRCFMTAHHLPLS